MLAYGRIPVFLDALMQVPCSKTYIISMALMARRHIVNADYI